MTPKKSKKTKTFPVALIAPCGMNCRLCYAYMRDTNTCPGCRNDSGGKSKSVLACRIKNCGGTANAGLKYCFDCGGFPCARLKHLDKRYRTKYGMSMIDNLESIRKFGIRHFIRAEKEKWKCPKCGEMLCVHKPKCLYCQHTWR